ncbi:hypothetical protein D9M71_392260 [compost metagenome]
MHTDAVAHQAISHGKGQVDAGVGPAVELGAAEQAKQRPGPTITETGGVAAAVHQRQLAGAGTAQVIGLDQAGALWRAMPVRHQLAIDAQQAAQGQGLDAQLHRQVAAVVEKAPKVKWPEDLDLESRTAP